MAFLFTGSKFSATDASGAPLAGGKVFTSAAGQTFAAAPLATYTDQSGDTENSNPVILDASGRASIWLGSSAYRFVITDADGVAAPDGTVDHIAAPATAFDLSDTTDVAEGDARLGVKLTDTGAVATTQHAVNEAEPRNPKLHFGSPWDNTTTSAVGLQNAVTAALAGRGEVFLPEGDILIDAGIELNVQVATGNYRQSLRLYGAGKKRTRLIHRVSVADSVHGRALFQHKLTQTQGDNNYFAHGLELAHMEIYGDGSTDAAAVAISLQGAYHPWLHDLHIDNMGSVGGIVTPGDSRWTGLADRYSCGTVTCERVTVISTRAGYGIKNQCFATAWKILPGCYIVANTGGGVYLEGANHHIAADAIAGNGSASGYGLYFARSSEGTPRNCVVNDGVEFDGNYNNQLRTNGINTQIKRVRFKDTASGGAFFAPTQVKVIALAGQTADANLIEYCNFDFVNNSTAASVTCVSFDLDVDDGRTVRYNKHVRPTIGSSGSGATTVTDTSFGTNPNVAASFPNRYYPSTAPEGTVVVSSTSKNIADASTTQVITGLGFRPTKILLDCFMNAIATRGYVDCSTLSPTNRGVYYYPTGAVWSDTGSNNAMTFRTAAGDQQDGYVSATSDDGFTITWTKTGSPTGTATIKYVAER